MQKSLIRALIFGALFISLMGGRPAEAQDALTGAALIASARSLVTDLQNLGANLGGDVMIATNNGATQISSATDHLQAVLNTQVNVPITQLNGTVRDEALLLNSEVTQINALLDRQRQCLFSQADIFIGGLNTAIATFKQGIPFVSAGGPTVTSFKFDGHNTPDIVPRDGGALVISGFKLWPNNLAPDVSITDGSTTTLSSPVPTRASDNNSYRVILAQDFLSGHAGQCLYIKTVVREQKYLFGIPIPFSETDDAPLVLPMCVPQASTTKVRLMVSISYDVAQDDQRPLDPWQEFGFYNSDCGNQHSVSMSHGWSVPPGYDIIDIQTRQNDVVNNNNNIQFSFNGTTITAAGTQDSPTCANLMFGTKLLHSAHWSFSARPIIDGTQFNQQTSTQQSDETDLIIPSTQICVYLKKIANEAGRATSISYTITPTINSKDSPPYESPTYTTIDGTPSTYTIPPTSAFNGEFNITGVYSPSPVNHMCNACVTLTAADQCGY